MDVEDGSEKWLIFSAAVSNQMDNVPHLVNFLMNTFYMLPVRVEDYFFFDMIAVDIHILILIGLLQKYSDSIFQSEAELHIATKVQDLGHTIYNDKLLGLHV